MERAFLHEWDGVVRVVNFILTKVEEKAIEEKALSMSVDGCAEMHQSRMWWWKMRCVTDDMECVRESLKQLEKHLLLYLPFSLLPDRPKAAY